MSDMTDGDTAPTPEPQAEPQPEAREQRHGAHGRASRVERSAAEEAAEREIEDLRRALEERDAQYVRLAADFENFRRRSAQEGAERLRYSAEPAAASLIPVLDNLQRALSHASPDADPGFVDGVRMVARQFEEALRSVGVTPIEALGQPFDPALHEAIGGEESPDVSVDTVTDELQPGYRLHDRVLRPSLVRVAHPLHAQSREG